MQCGILTTFAHWAKLQAAEAGVISLRARVIFVRRAVTPSESRCPAFQKLAERTRLNEQKTAIVGNSPADGCPGSSSRQVSCRTGASEDRDIVLEPQQLNH